jgi:hypothetical protein
MTDSRVQLQGRITTTTLFLSERALPRTPAVRHSTWILQLHKHHERPHCCRQQELTRRPTWRRTTRLWRSWAVRVSQSRYATLRLTGTGGSFGKVYKAIERSTGETVAIKHVGARAAHFTANMLTCIDRSRRQQRRARRHPGRNRAAQYLSQPVHHRIQDQLRQRRQAMDRHGVFGRRFCRRYGTCHRQNTSKRLVLINVVGSRRDS